MERGGVGWVLLLVQKFLRYKIVNRMCIITVVSTKLFNNKKAE